MRLWVRLALVMAALAVIPLLLVGGDAIRTATRRAEEASEAQLGRETTAQAELIGRWVLDQARLLLTWPQQFAGDRLQQFEPSSQLAFARMVYRGVPSAVTVVLVDGRGRMVVEPVFTTRGPRPASSRDRAAELVRRLPVAEALAAPDLAHLGVPWVPDEVDAVPSLPFAVLASGGATPEAQRILGVEVALEVADDIRSQSGPNRAVALIDAAGQPLVGGDHPLIRAELLASLVGTAQVIDFDQPGDRPVRGRLAPVPNTPRWSLVMAEPADVVLAPAREIRRRMGLSVVVAAGGAILLAMLLAGSLSTPVERLRDAALRVADGALGERAQVERSDEIGELARAFDHMSERLLTNQREIATQQDRIEGFNRELQEEVDHRTRELREAQAELVRSGQLAAVAELGAGLAHDLNNPLTAVLGIAQVLRARHPEETMLGELEAEAGRCRDVVATMLRVAELQVDPDQAPVVDLLDVLPRVAELVGRAFRQRGVELLVKPAGEGNLSVRADPAQCARLVAQVLAGVRSGLDAGSTVVMRALRQGDEVVVELHASRPVAEDADRRDDWMASGRSLWVARQMCASMGGELREDADRQTWRLALPGG